MSTRKHKGPFNNMVFIGGESFLIEEELSRLKQQLGDGASMNWAAYNAEDGLSMDEILSLCNTLPFLSTRRLIIIRNAHKLPVKQMDQVMAYLENPCESTTLVIVLESDKPGKDLVKTLKKFDGRAAVSRFDPIKNRAERMKWIMGRALQLGKKIERDACALLADMTGSSMWYLATELEKLSLFVADRPDITLADVQEIVMRTPEPAIFAFLDALFDRKKEVLSVLYELELAGIGELEIISRIENQIINHYVVLTGGDCKKMQIHDFVAEKAMRRKSSWSPSQLTLLLKEVREIEQKLKSSSLVHVYAALTELIGRHVLVYKE